MTFSTAPSIVTQSLEGGESEQLSFYPSHFNPCLPVGGVFTGVTSSHLIQGEFSRSERPAFWMFSETKG